MNGKESGDGQTEGGVGFGVEKQPGSSQDGGNGGRIAAEGTTLPMTIEKRRDRRDALTSRNNKR